MNKLEEMMIENRKKESRKKEDVKNKKIWTALVTPFDEKGEVDFSSLEKLMIRQSKEGHGILLLGSTGESLSLSSDEKKGIIQMAVNLCLDVPLMVGLGGHDQRATLDFLHLLEDVPVHGYLLTTPIYQRPGPMGQCQWFESILEKSSRPCMLYNIPSRSGVSLADEVISNLGSHENFWAIKEASGSIDDFINFVRLCHSDVDIYSGDDLMLPYVALLGAKGVVSVASNVWPSAIKDFVGKALKKELVPKDLLFWQEKCQSLFLSTNPIPAKFAMYTNQQILSPTCRSPLIEDELTEASKDRLLTCLQEVQVLYPGEKYEN